MTSKEIENNVVQLIDNFSQEEFIYDLLLAYGISKPAEPGHVPVHHQVVFSHPGNNIAGGEAKIDP